jgi:hypothetical protein
VLPRHLSVLGVGAVGLPGHSCVGHVGQIPQSGPVPASMSGDGPIFLVSWMVHDVVFVPVGQFEAGRNCMYALDD